MGGLWLRQEKFCHYYIIHGCAAEAARAAGYESRTSANQGYRLLQRRHIRRRILEILASMGEEQCRDLNILLGKLEAVYQQSLKDSRFAAAARAVELQARLSGAMACAQAVNKTINQAVNKQDQPAALPPPLASALASPLASPLTSPLASGPGGKSLEYP